MEKDKNNMAYRLNEQLMTTTDEFISANYGQIDICVLLGAANVYLAGLLVNAPDRQTAMETLAECYESQKRLINSTPASFFGKGLEQNSELN